MNNYLVIGTYLSPNSSVLKLLVILNCFGELGTLEPHINNFVTM